MKLGHLVGIIFALGILISVELISAKKVKNAEDFDKGGGKSGLFMVCGALLGSLIGGQSTIGTAQLAYVYGMSSIWFTMGAALGCVALFLGYIIPLRKSHDTTLMEVVGDRFGAKAEYIGSVLCSAGILVSVVSNIIASAALITALSGWPLWAGCMTSAVLMCAYVVFGGVIGAEMGGIVKVILLCFTTIICIVVVFCLSGEIGPGTALDVNIKDLFARGFGKEIANCFSLILGVLSTQTYAQAIWSAKSYHVARKAALLSGALCIPVGIGGMLVGLYMRTRELSNPAEAFPRFLLENLNPVVGGICIGALLITVVTGGGGLVLGVSTIFVRDIFGKIKENILVGKNHIFAMRMTIAFTLALTTITAIMIPGAMINDLGFLSMGLRGTVVFVPLTIALYFKGGFRPRAIETSMIAGPSALIISHFVDIGEPLIIGVSVSIIICLIGCKRTEMEILK